MITTRGWVQSVDYQFSASGQVDLISMSYYTYSAVVSVCCLALLLLA